MHLFRDIAHGPSQGALVVKNLPASAGVWSLGQENPLEEEMATHSSTLAWEVSQTEEPGGLESMVSQSWSLSPISLNVQPPSTLFSVSMSFVWFGFDSTYKWNNKNILFLQTEHLYTYEHAYTHGGHELVTFQFRSIQSLSCVQLLVTPWTAACQASLSITNSWSLLNLMSIESVMPSNHLILCHFLLLPPSIFCSIIFSSVSVPHIRWPNIGVSASVSVLPMNIQDWFPLGLTGLISLRSKGLPRVFFNTQFKSINSSSLSFLHSPTLTSIHDHWKNHSLD